MKSFIKSGLVLCLFNITTVLYAGSIDILGVAKSIDTLEYKVVGPGTVYTRFSLPDYPLSVYMMTVDLNNPYNFVETFQAGEQVGKTEAMTSAFGRLNAAGHRTIGGINGNFWIVSGQGQPAELLGVPHSGSMKNGVLITDPNGWNRGRTTIPEELLQEIGFAVIDKNRKIWIDDMDFDGKVTIDGIGSYPISEINRIRKTNELVFFNNYMGSLATRTDDDGTEVFIKPVENQSWNVNGEVLCKVVRIVKDKGANAIPSGESVLSGTGTAKTFLENLTEGQTLKVNMGIYTLKDNERPMADQMLTGNALVMKNGELTIRNTNEAYNSQLYPRTGIGMSQDGKKLFLIVIDKSAGSIGASTGTMCGILKAFGAYNATSMDGGGSAQMMLNAQIVNNSADGKERAVADGWFVYHNAPDDNVITKLEFADYKLEIPVFANYKPVILGYNQYGVLVDKNVQGCIFSCSNGIGYIDAEFGFVAAENIGIGNITAQLNGVSVSKSVRVISSNIKIKLDSVLIDQRRSYPVEVLSTSGTKVMSVSPSLLNWVVADLSICEMKNGLLKGLKNGSTFLVAQLGNFKDTIKVKVEIPESAVMSADNFNPADWTLEATSALNATLNSLNTTDNTTKGAAVNFVYNSARGPYIKLSRKLYLYSLPDTIILSLNTGDISLSKMLISLQANNSTGDVIREFNSFVPNTDSKITIPIASVFDNSDISVFPIRFNYLNFYLNAMTTGQSYQLKLNEILLCYKDFTFSADPSVLENGYSVYPNPSVGKFSIKLNKPAVDQLKIQIYSVSGEVVYLQDYNSPANDKFEVETGHFSPGVYILKVSIDKQQFVSKINIKK